MVTIEDFPDHSDPRAEIFIQWVRLCEIIGRIGKALVQGKADDPSTSPANDLIAWIQELPHHLQLPLSNDRRVGFSRDIHLLHLPYLATLILLHLQRGTQRLPKASATAIVAASCVARIVEDFLARSTIKFLPGQAGWYIAIAILALLHARHIQTLTQHAETDIATLRAALGQMATRWHSSKMFAVGFERILDSQSPHKDGQNLAINHEIPGRTKDILAPSQPEILPALDDLNGMDTIKWTDCFPFITTQTSPLIGVLLANSLNMPFSGFDSSQFTYLFDFLDGLDPELLHVDSNL